VPPTSAFITGRDDEFRATITILYQQELGRDPDPDGMASWLNHARYGMTGDGIRAALHDSPEGVAYRARPPAPPAPPPPSVKYLHTIGRHFYDQHNDRVVIAGLDQFRAYDRYLLGDGLLTLIQESRDLGAWSWRVFLMADSFMQLGPLRPGFYDNLRPFVQYLNDAGIVPLLVLLADAQIVLPKTMDQRSHAEAVYDAVKGTSCLLSVANEYGKNGVDVSAFTRPPWSTAVPVQMSEGLVWSRGSNLSDQPPPQPYGTFAEFHPRRDMPAMLYDTVASPGYLYSNGLTVPLVCDEPIGFGMKPGRSNDPDLARRLASLYAIEWDGLYFHSDYGIQSQVIGPDIRPCAEAWFEALYRCSGIKRGA